ncbi:MAG: RHS repeat protein, partial [Chloroflexia bacterium]|nr:RHS repeat protein [Chloroflexia bacterium]
FSSVASRSRIQLQNNTCTANGTNGIALWGTMASDLRYDNLGCPLVLTSDLFVPSNRILTLLPGTVVKLSGGTRDLNVNGGTLVAEGTAQQPIVFTSLKDDSFGGDTNNDGSASSPAPGDWGALDIYNSGTARLRHVQMRYGGSSLGIIELATGNLALEAATLAHSGRRSIYVSSGNAIATISATNFLDSSRALESTGTNVITATHNYWGSPAGPYTEANPNGRGAFVRGNVLIEPWSPAPILPEGGRLKAVRITSNGNTPQEQRLGYDALGRVTTLSSNGYSEYQLGYEYDASDRLVARIPLAEMPLSVTLGYDAADQLTTLGYLVGSTTVLSESYAYDAVGNLTTLRNATQGTTTYSYDALNRLIGVASDAFSASYAYDAAGNRTQAGSISYSYDAGGRVISASDGTTFSYDASGNLTTRIRNNQTTRYTWNSQNELARIDYPDGTFSAYQYDDYGRRISKRLPDGSKIEIDAL